MDGGIVTIDTRVEGNPESVRAAAHWLRSALAVQTVTAADDLFRARNLADAGWEGAAGEGFVMRAGGSAARADELGAVVGEQAQAFDDVAVGLQRALDDMREVRETAAVAGLTVVGDLIEAPGSPPASPGPLPSGPDATDEALAAHAALVDQFERHEVLVKAYDAAKRAADVAREVWKHLVQACVNAWNDLNQKWFFVVGDLLNGVGGTAAAWNTSTMLKRAQLLDADAAKFLSLAKSAPAGTPAAAIYRDVDMSRTFASSADDLAEAAVQSEAKAGRVGFRLGGALAVASIGYDIINDKPVEQAVVSGVAGFGASVAAGALIGTAIPAPVLGTALGAVGGAAVGLFTSGLVDSVYQKGVDDLGESVGDATDAVVDTGKAIGGLVKDGWDAVF